MNRFVLRRIVQLDAQARQLETKGLHEPTIKLRKEICHLVRDHLGESHPWRISRLLDLAASYRRSGDARQAETIYSDLIRRLGERYGDHHLDLARGLNALGVLYCETQQHGRAIGLFERALSISQAQLPPYDPRHAAVLNNMACAHHALGHLREAEAFYLEALEIYDLAESPALLEQADCRCDLAELAADEERFKDCEKQLEKALDLYRTLLAKRAPDFGGALIRIAHLYNRIRCSTQAITLLEEAIEIFHQEGETQECQLAFCLDQLSEMQ